MKRSIPTIAILLVLATAGLVIAYSTGPLDGRTNAPGETNCTDCHNQFALNSGSGQLKITLPTTYKPGDTLSGRVDLAQIGQQRWGFEMTVLSSGDEPIGHLLVADSIRTQLSVAVTGREYLKHTSVGTDMGVADTAPGWTFFWIAPDTSAGPAIFYAAGNAADGLLTQLGDYIYTTVDSVALDPQFCCVGNRGNIDNDPGDVTDISDLIYLVEYSFSGGPAPVCAEEADVNADGSIDIADLIYLVEYSFAGGPAPLPCP